MIVCEDNFLIKNSLISTTRNLSNDFLNIRYYLDSIYLVLDTVNILEML